MLGEIQTGYEGKFDFPHRTGGPDRTYLLASLPRAGSTHFSHILWETGCFGAPLEYLNFQQGGPYGFAAQSPEMQLQLWRSVLRRRCSRNGVFGLKVFSMQLDALERKNPGLLKDVMAVMLPRDGPRHVIYLRRRDRAAQTVSYARASLSGVWRREQESADAPPTEYSDEAVDAAERGIAFQESVWEQMFNDLRLEPLALWHEDILADAASATQQVAHYLGVSLDPDATIAVPEVEKQSEGDSKEWLARYAARR